MGVVPMSKESFSSSPESDSAKVDIVTACIRMERALGAARESQVQAAARDAPSVVEQASAPAVTSESSPKTREVGRPKIKQIKQRHFKKMEVDFTGDLDTIATTGKEPSQEAVGEDGSGEAIDEGMQLEATRTGAAQPREKDTASSSVQQ